MTSSSRRSYVNNPGNFSIFVGNLGHKNYINYEKRQQASIKSWRLGISKERLRHLYLLFEVYCYVLK